MPIKRPNSEQKPTTLSKDTFLIRWQNRWVFFTQKFKRKILRAARRIINATIQKHRHFPNFYLPNSRPPYPKTNPKTEPSNSYKNTSGNTQTFILYRIIGNDLIPRHSAGQSYKNLEFILQHEPPLEGCKKVFILNRIIDPSEETAIIQLLCNYKQSYLRIPFHRDEYKEIGWNILDYPINYAPYKLNALRMRRDLEIQAELGLYRYKNNYVMNNNGARNLALQDGKAKADWILPWDGNCFVSSKAWTAIRQQVLNHATYPYHIIPMARLLDNQSILCEDFEPDPTEEPQVLFRSDSTEIFDSRFCYGRRPKVEFLWRLGVPGKWDDWAIFPWDLPCPEYSKHAGHYSQGAWVARLFSGKSHLERTDQQSSKERGETRSEAILSILDQLDECSHAARKSTSSTMLTEPISTGSRSFSYIVLLNEATQRAERALQKLQPNSTDSLLQDLVIAGMAQSHHARPEFSELIDNSLLKLLPSTQNKENSKRIESVNPSLLAIFLSTIKGLKQQHQLNSMRVQQLDNLMEEHFSWLTDSPCGQSMRSQLGYLGTQYDLRVAAVAHYLDQAKIARKTFRDSRFRILEQFDFSGKQQSKVKGKNHIHYECLNLQLWIYLSELAMIFDEDLWGFTAKDGSGIQQGIRWFIQAFENRRDSRNIDRQRLLPIINAYRQQYGELSDLSPKFDPKYISQCKSVFPIETAIYPFWNLGFNEYNSPRTTTKKLTPETLG